MKSTEPTKPQQKWLFGRIFQPTTDFYAMLNTQAKKTVEGMQALSDWVNDEKAEERCQTVRDLENEADELKLELGRRLQESFITPFDREDIYDISLRLDEVINAGKSVVREIEAFGTLPSLHPEIRQMAAVLLEGTQALALSIAALRTDLREASNQASIARKADNRLSKVYRTSMQQLLLSDDLKMIIRVTEVYKSLLLGGERIDVVGEHLLHAIMKMS
jgi:uncharacterized protein Yka (UPF0111/DUF47 family)